MYSQGTETKNRAVFGNKNLLTIFQIKQNESCATSNGAAKNGATKTKKWEGDSLTNGEKNNKLARLSVQGLPKTWTALSSVQVVEKG